MSDKTCKSAIVSRAENRGEAAIISWGEWASVRVLRVTDDNICCILDNRALAGFGPPRYLHYFQYEVQITGPPLSEEEVERLKLGEQL